MDSRFHGNDRCRGVLHTPEENYQNNSGRINPTPTKKKIQEGTRQKGIEGKKNKGVNVR